MKHFKKTDKRGEHIFSLKWYVTTAVCLFFLSLTIPQSQAANLPGLTVQGVGSDGTETPVAAYRWLVQKDLTYHVPLVNGQPQPDPQTLAVNFHRSYMPVTAKGCVGYEDLDPALVPCDDVMPALDPDSYYFVSVLPRAGYSISGTPVRTDGAGNPLPVTVYVNAEPIPTAQITVLVFEDDSPINNSPDFPQEDPVNDPLSDMSGFTILVEDAGGRYGASAGLMSLDVFGNPLGTTYDAGGNVTGYSPLKTGPDGRITIKNLAPGKYGIQAVPPAGTNWQQTSTIEGTRVIDAWVKANEPPFFAEFGPPGFHVFIGFVKNFDAIPHPQPPDPSGTALSGTVVNLHLSRPPSYAFYSGACFGHTTPWVGLNDLSVGIGAGIYAAPTDQDCNFTIPNVPDGNYQLVVWDNNLDLIFAFKGVTIEDGVCNTPDGSCNLGDVPVFQWFSRQEHFVYNDVNGDGFWQQDVESPINDQAINLRWRDGTIYQQNVTDFAGAYAFDQIFPFFAWLVAEVDFTRLQATGVTVTVDNGGPIDPSNVWTFGGQLNPQDQTNPPDPVCADLDVCEETENYRVEKGPVLTQAFQGFLGQTSVFQWGKRHYPDGENGGISGIVYYAVTRAENDPEMAGAEVWEPGIPGVTVNLYESLGVDPATGVASKGVLLNSTTTDSWDDSIPEGCKYGDASGPFIFDPDGAGPIPPTPTDCFDGLRNFNQVRPGLFDGGYAFDAICTGGLAPDGSCAAGLTSPMPIGEYIVEVIPPPGYELVKEEDKNVDFGDEIGPPVPELLPPPCVGQLHALPPYLTLFPDEQIRTPFAWRNGVYTPVERNLCDCKLVTLSAGANPPADFHLFTEVPVASQAYGFILDDTQNEFDPNAPNFGEKYAPPFMPVSIRDWTGREIGRTYSDQYGVYNFMAPSTATANIGAPSGMSPNMLTTCMNDKLLTNGSIDPNHNPIYSQFCYTFQYMPGVTTYLDTPVVPVGAFAGPDQFPVDCEFPDGTPRIYSVAARNGVGGGPYLPAATGAERLIIQSIGDQVQVPNPNYCNPAAGTCPAGADTINKLIARDYGFGSNPTVKLVAADGTEHLLTGITGTAVNISGTVPSLPNGTYQLVVTRTNGLSSLNAVTVQIGLPPGAGVTQVTPSTQPLATPIQDAIDAAGPNDLILVSPGQYAEMVIMWKPVRLQGWGEGSIINALKAPTEKLATWRAKVESLIQSGSVNLLPGQEVIFGGPEPEVLFNEEGAGILVLTASAGVNSFNLPDNRGARSDGFTITGADTGGGIVVNGNAPYMEISNNRIINNSGFFSGGIRVGHPEVVSDQGGGITYTDAHNDFTRVHNNQVVQNGSLDGAGAGITMCTGSDSYEVAGNFVCGNFTMGQGGGIGHLGLSDKAEIEGNGLSGPVPLIKENVVIFNEIFNQLQSVSGGGILISGGAPLAPNNLSPGSGNVRVISNLIQGNAASAGDGGGIRLSLINGQDVSANPNNTPPPGPDDPPHWYAVDVFNNMIVNNVAGMAGGGISLQDAANARVINNTIANNDSLGTAGEAFSPGNPNQSNPQPAGIVSRRHTGSLIAAIGSPADPRLASDFSNPQLEDNIVWDNRSFFFFIQSGTPGDPGDPSVFGLCPDLGGLGLSCPVVTPPGEIAVLGTAGSISCNVCLQTGGSDPLFVQEYHNGNRGSVAQPELTSAIQAPPAFDEGGNFIRPRFGPLSINVDLDGGTPGVQVSDYHIQEVSPAVDAGIDLTGTFSDLETDYDGDARPGGGGVEIGADEIAEGGEAAAADRVAITSATYYPRLRVLEVIATTDAPADSVTLTAHWNDGDQNRSANLSRRSGRYLSRSRRTGAPVGRVTVTSTGGGSDTAAVTFPSRRP